MKIRRIDPTPENWLVRRAREDDARVTGQPLVERPIYFENVETGQKYYWIFGCIGWPNIISDKPKAANRPGYIAIVGVIKGNKRPPEQALYQILAESESHSVNVLITEMLRLREEWGFGLHPELLHAFYGDQDRFIMELATVNTLLTKQQRKSILITSPLDLDNPKSFDLYVRALTEVLNNQNQRLYYGRNDILKNRVGEYTEKDPVIVAMGGLVYSLSLQTPWLDVVGENIFNVEEA
jgi:hypothetical protein